MGRADSFPLRLVSSRLDRAEHAWGRAISSRLLVVLPSYLIYIPESQR